ncbi:MAG: hypothetical protein CMP65_01150 [Flavobacteriales bacterium]|nr:hypothetical protein [Flavobacteriales bacterium]
MKKISVLIIIILMYSTKSKSQNEITDFLIGSTATFQNDTEQLIEGYMSPFGKWFGTGLNAGWYNTAKSHQFPGFDITGGIHFITAPQNATSFQPILQNFVINNDSGKLPTFIGDATNTSILYTNPLNNELEPLFDAPGGVEIGTEYPLPMPFIQGSIGLVKKTEILFRLAPKINIEDLTAGFWGIGLKHDIKQWIPGLNVMPFDFSFLGGYSNLNSSVNFDYPGQNLVFDVKAFNANFILSKKIAFLTPYLGFGYQYSSSHLALEGEYTILDWDGEALIPGSGTSLKVNNPFDISFGGVNGLKANAGIRIKLLLFTIHAEWAVAEYNMFTIGIGLNSDIGSKLIGGLVD